MGAHAEDFWKNHPGPHPGGSTIECVTKGCMGPSVEIECLVPEQCVDPDPASESASAHKPGFFEAGGFLFNAIGAGFLECAIFNSGTPYACSGRQWAEASAQYAATVVPVAKPFELAAESTIVVRGSIGAESSVQGFRLGEQLAAEEAAGARAPIAIVSWSEHALEQVAGRDGGIGVSRTALEDAFANPNAIQYAPSEFGATFRYVGDHATVVVNTEGNVVTGWANSALGVGR